MWGNDGFEAFHIYLNVDFVVSNSGLSLDSQNLTNRSSFQMSRGPMFVEDPCLTGIQ